MGTRCEQLVSGAMISSRGCIIPKRVEDGLAVDRLISGRVLHVYIKTGEQQSSIGLDTRL